MPEIDMTDKTSLAQLSHHCSQLFVRKNRSRGSDFCVKNLVKMTENRKGNIAIKTEMDK